MTPIELAAEALKSGEFLVALSVQDLAARKRIARAALAAIEEPSEAMIKAGEDALSFVQTDDAKSVWIAMHKAMIGENSGN